MVKGYGENRLSVFHFVDPGGNGQIRASRVKTPFGAILATYLITDYIGAKNVLYKDCSLSKFGTSYIFLTFYGFTKIFNTKWNQNDFYAVM